MRILIACLFVVFFISTAKLNAQSNLLTEGQPQKRIALVIGIGDYQFAGKLTNTINDHDAMSAALKSVGFDVVSVKNPSLRELEAKLDEFTTLIEVGRYPVALCFYSGHGLQVNGENYLVPVDANPERQSDVKWQCLNAERILDRMESAYVYTKIVLLDACRNNPLPKAWGRSNVNGGLTGMNTPSGTFIGYATAANTIASDGDGHNSPYTSSLLQHLQTPGLDIYNLFTRVAKETQERAAKEGRVQTPYFNTNLTDVFYFVLPNPEPEPEPAPPLEKDPLNTDGDQDGFPDGSDECPDQYGTLRGCQDSDDDGTPDKSDNCPFEAGPSANMGCPLPDRDKDGVADAADACPDNFGEKRWQGCPDTDGDLLPDHLDKCPSESGDASNDGCPVKVFKEKSAAWNGVEHNFGLTLIDIKYFGESVKNLGVRYLYTKTVGFSVEVGFHKHDEYYFDGPVTHFTTQAGVVWRALTRPNGLRLMVVPNFYYVFGTDVYSFGLQSVVNYKSFGVTLGLMNDFSGNAKGYQLGAQYCLNGTKK